MAASNSEMESLSPDDSLPSTWAADDVEKRARVKATMEAAGISAVSIATVAGGKISSRGEFPESLTEKSVAVDKNTVFGAASLSKPVFSYLVLKLIEANAANTAEKGTGKFILPEGLDHFDLDTPLADILPLSELTIEGVPRFDTSDEAAVAAANKLTARMVLSHQTGLEHGACQFQFEPGEGHGYSNVALLYLQAVIEKLTASRLETLADKHVFTPLQMDHSSFICDKNNPEEKWDEKSINSLHTTASDYALFVNAWMHDAALQQAFIPHVFMTEDKGQTGRIGAAKGHIPDSDLEHVAWGLGWGLQTDDDGKVTTAYHEGNMNEWRAWAVMNLTDKTATVFFANSQNGHVLAEQIIPETTPMQHANNYFFPKWGFASRVEDLRPDWRENPAWGMARPEAFIPEHRLQSIAIPVDLESAGKIEIRVSNKTTDADRIVSVIYHPDTEPSKPVFFGSRDVTGMGHMVGLNRMNDGTWRTDIPMKANESREFSMHVGMPEGPPDFASPQHFKSQIGLMHGKLVGSIYANPQLPEEKKGRLERRIYRPDGSLSEPLPVAYEKKPEEEIVDIYLPAGYTPEKKYPMQIYLDGDMHVRQDSFGNSMGTPHILDNLIESGQMEPVIAVFTAPSPVAPDGSNPRLREYGCNPETATKLAQLPQAAVNSGLSAETHGATICGQSMGGLQAIYTAKMHPDVFAKVVAQSPAVWWEPPLERSAGPVFYENDTTWRHTLRTPFPVDFQTLDETGKQELSQVDYKGYIHDMLETGVDRLSGKPVPEGQVEIVLQAGTHETGTVSEAAGFEPLTQATKTLARQLNITPLIHDGAHSSEPWAAGLAITLPAIHPGVMLTATNSAASSTEVPAATVDSQVTSRFKARLADTVPDPIFDSELDKEDKSGLTPFQITPKP